MVRLSGLFALLITLSGCSGEGEVHTATVAGEVTYLERIALPPDARIHVTLRIADRFTALPYGDTLNDSSSAGVPQRSFRGPDKILARQSGVVTHAVPIPFSLRYDTDGLDPLRAMVIEAWISAGEQVLFATTETTRVQIGASAVVRLTLRRPRHVTLACADGSRPTAAFPMMGELAFLEISDTAPVALRARPVASGFHYGGDGYSLRGRGNEALLRRPTGGETRCEAQPPTLPSPPITRR